MVRWHGAQCVGPLIGAVTTSTVGESKFNAYGTQPAYTGETVGCPLVVTKVFISFG